MNKREIDFKTSEQLQSAELKAALYAGGNLSKIVRKAVAVYSEGLPYETVMQDIKMNINGYTVYVRNVPHVKQDEETLENLVLSATLERIIEQKLSTENKEVDSIFKKVISTSPELEVDFNDLL